MAPRKPIAAHPSATPQTHSRQRRGNAHAPDQAEQTESHSSRTPQAPVQIQLPEPSTGSIIEQHPSAPPVVISQEMVITGDLAEGLWDAYRDNFEPLTALAIMRHFVSREELLTMLANPRIHKIVGWQSDEPVGLAMVTNSLDDVKDISPNFLRTKYPDHASRNAIYYGILVMVSHSLRGRTLFGRLYTELWQIPALDAGILVFDACEFNRTSFGADELAQRIADRFPHSSLEVLDRQTWYVAELPEPIPPRLES